MEYVRMDFYTITGGMTMHSRVNNNSRKHIRHAISIIQLLSLIYKKKELQIKFCGFDLRVMSGDVESGFMYKAGGEGNLRSFFMLLKRNRLKKAQSKLFSAFKTIVIKFESFKRNFFIAYLKEAFTFLKTSTINQ